VSKFRMKMKIQGFELEIEGAREDAATISQNIGAQLSSLMQPASSIIEGDVIGRREPTPATPQLMNGVVKKQRRMRRPSIPVGGEQEMSPAIDFVSSPAKFGNPKQQWKTADKAIWLIYVLHENGKGSEFSTRTLQSGTITTSNVTRDLGRLKTKTTPAVVGENSAVNPSRWLLTEAGTKRAQNLVAEALGEAE
jgi:hypothetical protein